MNVRIRIKELLQKRGRSAYWLANEVGITHGGLYKVLHNKVKALNLELLAKICAALECEPGDLLVLERERPKAKRA
ncbi:MAG TPA: helix-turn-helix transcriptional regulator [Blastocatellia bacterium]|nr:helix-turn-helix transcriptional regulator [Blastocatellia bacterium]